MSNDVLLVPINVEQPNVEAQSDFVVYVPQAHKNKPGIVKEGDGINIENGTVSLNRQTVEDMIDANKWVSYGSQQNLTEEEKGLARHNIGAGDNDFTGSYYDITQKPQLNTNNSASLPIGDEEINNTIDLHKISKTGSFEDLNNKPTDALNFAESERQKSKNLFNVFGDYTKGISYGTANYSVSQDGVIKTTNAYATSNLKGWEIPVKRNTTYTIQANLVSSTEAETRCYYYLYNGKSYTLGSGFDILREKQLTFTTLDNTKTIVVGFASHHGGESQINNVQVEEGSIATEYMSYQGLITHNGDAPVAFAESERQKSKNLLNLRQKHTELYGVSYSYNEPILSVNTLDEYPYHYVFFPLNVEVGKTYTISCNCDKFGYVAIFNKALSKSYVDINVETQISVIFTPSEDVEYVIGFYGRTGEGTFNYSNIQVEAGTVETDYQPYKGPITHNGDEPVVFAESERQKSKNLLQATEFKNGWVDGNGQFNASNTCSMVANLIKVEPNTEYTYSVNITMNYLSVAGYDENGVFVKLIRNMGQRSAVTFTTAPNIHYLTVTAELAYETNFPADGIMSYEPQIEVGNVRTDYQPYNGKIVHEKQLNETVEKRELIYSEARGSSIHIGDSLLTELKEYVDLFSSDLNKSYTCAIGNASTSNFKTLVGNPFSAANYVSCYVKPYAISLDANMLVFELLALNYYDATIAKGYIYRNAGGNVHFRGWEVI